MSIFDRIKLKTIIIKLILVYVKPNATCMLGNIVDSLIMLYHCASEIKRQWLYLTSWNKVDLVWCYIYNKAWKKITKLLTNANC